LAFLLNPDCTGSSEPLSALLGLASITESVDFSEISITREYTCPDQRRIDFLIETSTHLIGIENKIWSGLQENQLRDYKKQLSAEEILNSKKLVLILLYPQRNNSLPVHSTDDLYTFCPVTYEDLVAEFRKIRFNIFENLRATVLLEDFIVHMEEYIMQKPSENALNIEMWNFEANYHSELNRLQDALKNSRVQLNKYIADRMMDIVKTRPDCDQWQQTTASTYYQLYKTSWANLQVHFELLKVNSEEMAPTQLDVVLHTNERKKEWRTDELKSFEGRAGTKRFSINYASRSGFETAMDEIFKELENLVNAYTEQIDIEIAKSGARK